MLCTRVEMEARWTKTMLKVLPEMNDRVFPLGWTVWNGWHDVAGGFLLTRVQMGAANGLIKLNPQHPMVPSYSVVTAAEFVNIESSPTYLVDIDADNGEISVTSTSTPGITHLFLPQG